MSVHPYMGVLPFGFTESEEKTSMALAQVIWITCEVLWCDCPVAALVILTREDAMALTSATFERG